MARQKKFTELEVKNAIIEAKGFLSKAAAILHCSVKTVENYINRSETLKDTVKEMRYKVDDLVESSLLKGITEGNPALIIFYCKTKLRHRGYTDKDSDSKNETAIEIKHEVVHINKWETFDTAKELEEGANNDNS